MVHSLLTALVGTIGGSLIGVYAVLQMGTGGGFPTLIDIIFPAFSGASIASPLGVFTGITGGIIGGLVGVIFAVFLPSWLFTGTPLSSILAAIVVSATLSTTLALFAPH